MPITDISALGDLTPEDLTDLESLNDEIAAPTPRRANPKRKRQTYRPRYRHLMKIYNERVRANAAILAPSRALAYARGRAIKEGRIEETTIPDERLVESFRASIVRSHNNAVRSGRAEFFRSRGIDAPDAVERRRAQWRNSKLRKSAETYQSGEDVSRLYDTERKLMSPEQMKAHDNEKRRLAQKARRAKKRLAKVSQN